MFFMVKFFFLCFMRKINNKNANNKETTKSFISRLPLSIQILFSESTLTIFFWMRCIHSLNQIMQNAPFCCPFFLANLWFLVAMKAHFNYPNGVLWQLKLIILRFSVCVTVPVCDCVCVRWTEMIKPPINKISVLSHLTFFFARSLEIPRRLKC